MKFIKKGEKTPQCVFKGTELKNDRSWNWLRKGDLEKAAEITLFVAQQQAVHTWSIQYQNDNTGDTPISRLCAEGEETQAHILYQCKTLSIMIKQPSCPLITVQTKRLRSQ